MNKVNKFIVFDFPNSSTREMYILLEMSVNRVGIIKLIENN